MIKLRYEFLDKTTVDFEMHDNFLLHGFPNGAKHGCHLTSHTRDSRHEMYLDGDKSQVAGMPVFVEKAG